MNKIDLNDYLFHGVRNINTLKDILTDGILTRKELSDRNRDVFATKDDFLSDKATNGMNSICVSLYNSLSYKMFNYPFINLIINKIDDIEHGSIDGEILINRSIKREEIIGLGIYLSNLKQKKYSSYIHNYISIIKDIYNYKIDIYNLETGKIIEKNSIKKYFSYLDIKPSLNILLLGKTMSGLKEILSVIEKKYKVNIYENKLLNNIKDVKERYEFEKNNNDSIIIYTKSLDECVSNNNYLKDVKYKNTNYDLIIHLESMLNNYKRYYKKIPKDIKLFLNYDKEIYMKYSKNKNYYRIPATKRINDKLNYVLEILNLYIDEGGKNEKKDL